MMKSFFKKLAFVMALAMVVSAMAPAATTAKAADAGICLQTSNYEIIKTYEMTEGDAPVDFKFAGAPTNWRTLGLTWDSSDKTVATVDQTGLVTAVAAGETVISVKGEGYEATLTLTVKAKEEVPAYVVKQTAGDKLTITWADAKEATDKVEVYKVYALTDGNRDVKWPSETVVKDGVATVTVKYGGLEDGCDYVVKFGETKVTLNARVGKVVKIEVTPVTVEKNDKNEEVESAALYVSKNEEYPIRFNVTYITDNDIKLTTAPANTYVNFEVMEGGDDIYLDSTGEASFIYEDGAWAHVMATYCYKENDEEKTLPFDFFIEGEKKPAVALAGVTKYALVGVDEFDASAVAKKDVAWNGTEIIVDDRGRVALEIADTFGGLTYIGVTDTDVRYDGTHGEISFLSANDSVALVGDNGLVTPVSTGTTAVIVQLTNYVNGEAVVKNIYAFDITVKASRAVDEISANSVTVLTSAAHIDSKATVEISALDNYDKAWTDGGKGWSATVETTSDVKDSSLKKFTVKDSDDGKVDGKATITIDGSKFPKTLNSVTYKVTIGNKTTTFRVTLKASPTYVSGYLAEANGITVNGKNTGVINGEVKIYSYWKNNGVVYKLENVTNKVELSDGTAKYWDENTKNLKDKIVVTVVTPETYKGTVAVSGSAIVITDVANVPTDNTKFEVVAGDYDVTVNVVKNTSANTVAEGATPTYKVTRKSTEAELSFNVENKAPKFEAPVFKALGEGEVYDGADIEEVILNNVTYTLAGTAGKKAMDVISVDCIENVEDGKIYVKSAKVKVPVVYDGKEVGCYFEQTITINKLIECSQKVFK